MSLNKKQLQEKIHSTIPISEKMGYEIVEYIGDSSLIPAHHCS